MPSGSLSIISNPRTTPPTTAPHTTSNKNQPHTASSTQSRLIAPCTSIIVKNHVPNTPNPIIKTTNDDTDYPDMPSPIPIPKERDRSPISPNRGTNHAISLLGKSHRHINIQNCGPPCPHWAKGSPNQEIHDPSYGESSTTLPQSPWDNWRRNTNQGDITPHSHWDQGLLLSELHDPLYGESSSISPQSPTAHRQNPTPPTWFLEAIK